MLRRLFIIFGAALYFAAATAITQLGGLIFLAAVLLAWVLRQSGITRRMVVPVAIVFVIGALTIVNRYVVPPLAALNGRVALPCQAEQASYAALSPVYCMLGCNYVRPEVKTVVEAMARDLSAQYPSLTVAHLDAGFPFLDGFPLPPHLSHHDGRRIDLAYFYKDLAGNYAPLTTSSPVGYWGFEAPAAGDELPCADKVRWLTLRWDMGWFQTFVRKDLMLDQERTAAMLRWLVERGPNYGVDKILLEPHMAKRLQVSSPMAAARRAMTIIFMSRSGDSFSSPSIASCRNPGIRHGVGLLHQSVSSERKALAPARKRRYNEVVAFFPLVVTPAKAGAS